MSRTFRHRHNRKGYKSIRGRSWNDIFAHNRHSYVKKQAEVFERYCLKYPRYYHLENLPKIIEDAERLWDKSFRDGRAGSTKSGANRIFKDLCNSRQRRENRRYEYLVSKGADDNFSPSDRKGGKTHVWDVW